VPEGHTVHGHARRLAALFGDRRLAVSSPQGRFGTGARLLDGRILRTTTAHGKHLFLGFDDERWLHVHLGLFGTWRFGDGPPPDPRGAVRVALASADAWAHLRGPTACDVLATDEVTAVRNRLGADPLRADADARGAGERLRRSRSSVAVLLMRQDLVAGVGNVYRAESLFRARIDPHLPGRALPESSWNALWSDLVTLMRDGLRRGRIVTTRPQHRTRRSGIARGEDAYYVYRRAGLACRICGTAVRAEPLGGRTLYHCPGCQVSSG
jgi:endonuclease-8